MSGSIKTLTLLNRIMRGALTGVTLNDALADPATLGAFKTGLAQRAFCVTLVNDAAVAAIVFASARASSACFESAVMRKAIWESDTALAAMAASDTAKTTMRAASGARTVNRTCQTVVVPITDITSPCLLIGWSFDSSNVTPLAKLVGLNACLLIGWSFDSSNGSLTLIGRRAGSVVGVLTVAASTINGTTAAYDNVMALGPDCSVLGQTNFKAYFCVLPL